MAGFSLNWGSLITYLFETALFLIYSKPFRRKKPRSVRWAQDTVFCLLFVFCKYMWASNDLYNLLIMLVCFSCYFLLCCEMSVGALAAHSCVFAAMINLSRSVLYGTLRLMYGNDVFARYAWLLRGLIFIIKGASVFACRKAMSRLDGRARLNPIHHLLAVSPFLFLLAMYFGIMRNDVLLQASARSLLIVHIALCFAAMMSITTFFVNLSRENNERYIARLETAMREAYSRAREKEVNDSEIRRLTHDIHHYLSALSDDERISRKDMQALLNKVEQHEQVAYSGNSVLDAVLNEKKVQADAAGVRIEYFLDRVDYGFMDGMDLCSIFGNALENAIEAAGQIEDPSGRWVSVKTSVLRGVWVLRVDNSYLTEPVYENGQYISTKAAGGNHGIGISSIRYCAQKYGGKVQIDAEKNLFTLQVMVPAIHPV